MNKIGRSKCVITPKESVKLCGHAMRKDKSTGVHDDLELHVLLWEVDDKLLCFINADIIGIDWEFGRRIKKAVHHQYDIDESCVIFSTTHTHSGPYTFSMGDDKPQDGYMDFVFDKTMEAIKDAYNNMQQYTNITYRQDTVEGFYGNRNGKDKFGDQMVTVIEFFNNKNIIVAIVNMSCHSTVNSPLELQISADLLGNVRRELTPYLMIEPFMMNGNAGDMSNRLYRHNNDFGELKRVSVGIASRIAGFNHEESIEVSNVQAKDVPFTVEYDADTKALLEKKKELEEKLQIVTEFDDRKWLLSEIAGCDRKLKQEHVFIDLTSTIIRMNDLELVIIPCELAARLGVQIKQSSNAKLCLVWGYANGHSTYVVEAKGFNGGHDGISTQLKKGQAEEYVGKLIENLY